MDCDCQSFRVTEVAWAAFTSDESDRDEEFGVDRRPIHGCIPCAIKAEIQNGDHSFVAFLSVFFRDVDEQGTCRGRIEVCSLDIYGHDPVRIRSFLRAGAEREDCAQAFQRWLGGVEVVTLVPCHLAAHETAPSRLQC